MYKVHGLWPAFILCAGFGCSFGTIHSPNSTPSISPVGMPGGSFLFEPERVHRRR